MCDENLIRLLAGLTDEEASEVRDDHHYDPDSAEAKARYFKLRRRTGKAAHGTLTPYSHDQRAAFNCKGVK